MTKPRFTPDPIPDGLDPELAAYLHRQFNRIDDWWPKDLEDRVKALEEIASKIGGVWPIIDYSVITFTGEATIVYEFACNGDSEVVADHAHKASNNSFEYSLETNSLWYLVGSAVSVVDRYPAIAKYSFDSNSSSEWDWTNFDADGGFGYLKMLDEYGSIGGGKYLYGDITKSDGWDYFVVFDISSGTPVKMLEAQHESVSYSPAKVIAAETNTHFVLFHDGNPNTEVYKPQINLKYPNTVLYGPAESRPEGWLKNTDITFPAGYTNLNAAAASASDSTFLLISTDGTNLSSFIHDGNTLSSAIESFSYGGTGPTSICVSGVRVGDYCYFLCNRNNSSIIRIRTSGSDIEFITASTGTVGKQYSNALYHSAELNGLMYFSTVSGSGYVNFYSFETNEITTCLVNESPGYTGNYGDQYTIGGYFKDGKYYALNGFNERDSDSVPRLTIHSVET